MRIYPCRQVIKGTTELPLWSREEYDFGSRDYNGQTRSLRGSRLRRPVLRGELRSHAHEIVDRYQPEGGITKENRDDHEGDPPVLGAAHRREGGLRSPYRAQNSPSRYPQTDEERHHEGEGHHCTMCHDEVVIKQPHEFGCTWRAWRHEETNKAGLPSRSMAHLDHLRS